jgi:hypothetical protein
MAYPDVERRKRFIQAWDECRGSPVAVSRRLGISERSVYGMRNRLADEEGIVLPSVDPKGGDTGWKAPPSKWPKRRDITCKDRSILVGSDAHFWPGIVTTAWRAFCKLAKQLEPEYVVLNGDTLDGATISRHDPISWENRPTLKAELEAVSERLTEIEKAAPNAKRLKTAGNHDTRFDRRLAIKVPEFRDVPGTSLQDVFPGWRMSWSIGVNWDSQPLMIKHAFRGGIHAVYNNTLRAGISICTGHLHAQLIRPFTDYRGTRYGIDGGTLADIDGPQFEYTLDNPVDWRSGFVVLTFDKKGRLQPPELVEVQTHGKDQAAFFRGKIVAEGRLE